MAKTFFSGKHTDGNFYTTIYSGTNGTDDQDLIANPLNRINDVLFHSNFAYLKSNISFTGTINLPVRTPTTSSSKKKGRTVEVPAYGNTTYQLSTTDYTSSGTAPIVILVDTTNNVTISGTALVQQANSSTIRQLTVRAESTGIYVQEFYFAYGSTLAAKSFDYKVYILKDVSAKTDTGKHLYISPTKMTVAEGKFNTDLGYINLKSGSSVGGTTTSYTETTNQYYETRYALKRYWKYRPLHPGGAVTEVAWDSYEAYNGNFEGVYDVLEGEFTEWYNDLDGYTYKRGSLVETINDYTYTWRYYALNSRYQFVYIKDTLHDKPFLQALIDKGITPQEVYAGSGYYWTVSSTGKYLAVGTIAAVNNGAAVQGYKIYRSMPYTKTTGRSGAAFVNGITINVESVPEQTSAGLSWNFDGIKNTYGEPAAFPTNTITGLNLI
jgi:hypothetical protein